MDQVLTGEVHVEVGQLWADNDPRAKGRVLEVVELLYRDVFASSGRRVLDAVRVRVVQDRREDCLRSSIGRESRIGVERLRPTNNGYRLIASLDGA